MSLGETHKTLGNTAFRKGDYKEALEQYSQAINAANAESLSSATIAIYLVNRSLSHYFLEDWKSSVEDAQTAINLDPKNLKAHYRLAKALLKANKFRDVRSVFHRAIKECGENNKELKELETEIFETTKIPVRPKPSDFELVSELGDGNFSKVYKTYLKSTEQVFSIKAIERSVIEKMKRRHPNISNEILMEKRVLQKLDHPGIVQLFATFQDYGTLYFQMEYVGGGDLWTFLHEYGDNNNVVADMSEQQDCHSRKNLGAQIGLAWSRSRVLISQILSALEHMHRRGIVHRDLKPENIVMDDFGNCKLIDFGTAKDLIQRDLNGPEFVGTPEYMAPETVRTDKTTDNGPAVDLWALGIIIYQLLLGGTPFASASPYLTFLKIKRGVSGLLFPELLPEPVVSIIEGLLLHDARARLQFALGPVLNTSTELVSTSSLQSFDYSPLRSHRFFVSSWRNGLDHGDSFALTTGEVSRAYHHSLSNRVASLVDLCVVAVARACENVAFATANNGGVRVKTGWMHKFNPYDQLLKLPLLKLRIMHLLDRRDRLKLPYVNRLFYQSLPRARCMRARADTREYIGLTRSQEGHFLGDFHFACLSDVSISADDQLKEGVLKSMTSIINRMRPKFVALIGNFISDDAGGDVSSFNFFQRCAARISDTIPTIFVPGPRDLGCLSDHNGTDVTIEGILNYRQSFGADYYAFWSGGVRCLVLNSSLILAQANFESRNNFRETDNLVLRASIAQETWFRSEIEQARLCANSIVVFTYHPLCYDFVDEREQTLFSDSSRKSLREVHSRYLLPLRHRKVHALISTAPTLASGEKIHEKDFVSFTTKSSTKNTLISSVDKEVDPEKSDSDEISEEELQEDNSCESPEIVFCDKERPIKFFIARESIMKHAHFNIETSPSSLEHLLKYIE